MSEKFEYPPAFVEYYLSEWEGKDPAVANIQALLKNKISKDESTAIAEHLRNGGEPPQRPAEKKEKPKKEKKKDPPAPAPADEPKQEAPAPAPAKPIIKKIDPVRISASNGFAFMLDKSTGKVSRFTASMVDRMTKKYPQRYERK